MANLLGNRLSRLVRERAYLSGSIPAYKQEVDHAQRVLDGKIALMNQALAALECLDQQIGTLSRLDPNEIAAIRATPRKNQIPRGDIRLTLIDMLREKAGPMTMVELVRRMASTFGWDLSTTRGRRYARDSVRGSLRYLRGKGAVERLSDHLSMNGITCGIWRWIGTTNDIECPPQIPLKHHSGFAAND